jgi:hypothetical protein
MTPLVWKLTVDSSDAIAQVKAFAADAAALSKAAPPIPLKIDVSAVVKAQKQVEDGAARTAAAQIKAAQQAEAAIDKAVTAELKAAEKQIAAAERASAKEQLAAERYAAALDKTVVAGNRAALELQKLAAITPGQKAAADFEAMSAKIRQLGGVAGNTALMEKALAAEQQRVASGLVGQGTAGAVAESGYNRANAGAMNLFHQLKDMASGLLQGQNPMQILAQQGPQVLDAFEMGGGAAATLGSALTTLAGPVSFVLAGLSSLAVVGTSLYGIYNSYNEVAETNVKVTEAQNIAYEALNPLLEDTRDTEIGLAEATGVLTKEMASMERAAIKSFGDYNKAVEETRAKLTELNAAQASVSTQLVDDAEYFAPAWTPLGKAIRGLTSDTADYQQQIDGATASMKVASDALAENHDKHIELAAAEQKEREEKEKQKESRKGHTAAVKEEADALRRLNEAMAAENALAEASQKKWESAETGLQNIRIAAEAAGQAEEGAIGKATIAMQQQIKKAGELRQQMLDVALTTTAQETANQEYHQTSMAVEAAYQRALTDIRQKAADAGDKLRAESAKKEAAVLAKGLADQKEMAKAGAKAEVDAAKSAMATLSTALNGILAKESDAAKQAYSKVHQLDTLLAGLSKTTIKAADLSGKALVKAYKSGEVAAGDLSDAQKAALESTLKAEAKAAKKSAEIKKSAAMEAWTISQGVAMAQATVNTFLAISSALADSTVPYPANLVVAAAAGAAGVAEEVSIATAKPPSFRSGGMVSDAAILGANALPDARLISAEVGEGVVNRRGMQAIGGEDGLRKITAGIPSAPPTINLRLRHEVVDRMVGELATRPSNTRSLLAPIVTRRNGYLGRG